MTEAVAVLVLFATPSPNIPRPITTPSMGPGTAMTAKNPVATRADTVNMMPLAASNPPIRYDLCFHDTTNAPIASTRALMGTTGTNHVGPAPVQDLFAPPVLQTMAAAPTYYLQKKAEPL